MEQLTATINASKVRRATLNNKEYLVAPLSLIVTGVLNGSKGSLFYPADEISKDPTRWNHTPIVVNHPVDNGVNISARNPDVLDKSGIGIVLKSHYANNKLRAEGWFDVEACRRISPYIYNNLVAGKPIELSTGLFTTNEPAQQGANYKGRYYDYVARDYVPDHLAILPDQVGACSLMDGCGVNVNAAQLDNWYINNGNLGSGPPGGTKKTKGKSLTPLQASAVAKDQQAKAEESNNPDDHLVASQAHLRAAKLHRESGDPEKVADHVSTARWHRAMSKKPVANEKSLLRRIAEHLGIVSNRDWSESKRDKLPNKDFAGPDESFPITTQADVDAAAKLVGHAKDPEAVKARIISIATAKDLSIPESWQSTTNEELVENGGPGSGPRPGGGKGKEAAHKLASHLAAGKYHDPSDFRAAYTDLEDSEKKDAVKELNYRGLIHPVDAKKRTVLTASQVISSAEGQYKEHKSAHESIPTNRHIPFADSEIHKRMTTNETQDDHVGTSITLDEGVPTMAKLSDDERKTIVNELVKNCSCQAANAFDESDRTTLMTFNDAKLTTLKNQRDKLVEQEAVVNAVKQNFGDIAINEMPAALLAAQKKKKVGKKEEMVEGDDEEAEGELPVKNQSRLSPEEKEDLAFARQIKTERKNQAIVKITANTRNKFSKEQLNGMTLDVLTNMTELAAPEENVEQVQNQRFARRPVYLGAAAPVSNQQELVDNAEQDKEDIEAMRPPVINYAELAKEHRQSDKGSQRQLATHNN